MARIDISDLAKMHGVAKLRFFIPVAPLRTLGPIAYTSSDDERIVKECVAVESPNRAVADGYKIALQPVDTNYARETFYQMDLESLMHKYPEDYRVTFANVGEDVH